jgi:hypothetical protein
MLTVDGHPENGWDQLLYVPFFLLGITQFINCTFVLAASPRASSHLTQIGIDWDQNLFSHLSYEEIGWCLDSGVISTLKSQSFLLCKCLPLLSAQLYGAASFHTAQQQQQNLKNYGRKKGKIYWQKFKTSRLCSQR